MAEERKDTPAAPVIPEAVEGGGAEKEQVHRDYQKEVAELGKLAAAAKAERLANEELSQRMDRQLERIQEAAKKNVPVGPDGTENIGKSGVSWEDVMNLRTRNPEIVEAQKDHSRAAISLMVRACRAGFASPGSPINLAKVPIEALRHLAETDEAVRDVRTRRQLAAGSWWDASTTSGGTEWVPTGFARTSVDFYFLDATVPAIFQQVTIPEGVGPFSIPIETTRAQADIESETTAASANFVNTGIFSQAQTDTIDFAPLKHGLGIGFSMEGNEDIVVDVAARSQSSVTQAMPRAATQCILNGQTASDATLDVAPGTSGFISADGYSDAAGNSGLRLHCIQGTDGAGTGPYVDALGAYIQVTDVLDARLKMGDFGAREDELAYITSGTGYVGMLQDTNVLTVDKMGPAATILSGQLAAAAGVPVMFTSEFPSLLTAAGVANGTGALTGGILVNHRRWYFATKRSIEVIMLPQPGMDAMNVIGRMRTHFKTAIAQEHNAHYHFNVPTV
jgi:hypothetical protein